MLAITYHTYGEGCVVVNRIDIEGTEPQSYQELGTCWILEGADTKRMCISHIEGEVYRTTKHQQFSNIIVQCGSWLSSIRPIGWSVPHQGRWLFMFLCGLWLYYIKREKQWERFMHQDVSKVIQLCTPKCMHTNCIHVCHHQKWFTLHHNNIMLHTHTPSHPSTLHTHNVGSPLVAGGSRDCTVEVGAIHEVQMLPHGDWGSN